jgi:BirA family biotin operon repressor/biotin-[acetyl-CoA-carboxylase] ligase
VTAPSPVTHRLERWGGESVAELAARWGVPAVEAYTQIGSTNDRAVELARRGARPLTTVVADAQTAGRGRRGTPWLSEAGAGLLLSVVLPYVDADGTALPLLAGLAVAEAVEAASGASALVKWPNDVLLADKKVAGVLCERTPHAVVVGVGVNLAAPRSAWPAALQDVAVSVEECTGVAPDRSVVCAAVLAGLRRWTAPAGSVAGPRSLSPEALSALAARDALRGRPIEAEAHGRGVAAGIDVDGALLMVTGDGAEARVVAGGVALVS